MNIRRNIHSLFPGPEIEIAALREGVAVMQSRDPEDPTSWTYQANIHANQCQHSSFFFLSWHRMYIYFFECILRDASGDSNLALPYWDYSNTAHLALPLPFREPADASNPLYVERRNPRINDGFLIPESLVLHTQAFNLVDFTPPPNSNLSFGGRRVPGPHHFGGPFGSLENTPHNQIHTQVGGTDPPLPPGWMATALSPLDPIFWLHHANIDRLWKRWLDQGGNRKNPVDDDVWMDTAFTFFDENSQEVSITGRDVLETVSQLGYRYDDDPPGPPRVPFAAEVVTAEVELAAEERQPTLLGASGGVNMIELRAEPVTVPIEVDEETKEAVARRAAAEVVEKRVVLNLEGIQYDRNPGVSYEVYINLPEGQEPDYQSEYFVGSLGIFSLEPDHNHGGPGHEAEGHQQPSAMVSFDITPNVRALQARREWREGQITTTFVMRGLIPPPGYEAPADVTLRTEQPAGRPRMERVTLTTE